MDIRNKPLKRFRSGEQMKRTVNKVNSRMKSSRKNYRKGSR